MSEWQLDSDLNGIVDQLGYDMNADGYVDAWKIDSTGDGYIDQHAFDTTGDARADMWATDPNQDGLVDLLWQDTDGNAIADFSAAPLEGMTMAGEPTSTGDPTSTAAADIFGDYTIVGGDTDPGFSGPYDASGNPMEMPGSTTVGPASQPNTTFHTLMARAQQDGTLFDQLTIWEMIQRQNLTTSISMF